MEPTAQAPMLSLSGAATVCTVDLSLMPKLMHAVTAARNLASPPLDVFRNGAYPHLAGYYDAFKRSPMWQRTAAYGDAGVVQFWGDYLVKLGKRDSYTKLPTPIVAVRADSGVRGGGNGGGNATAVDANRGTGERGAAGAGATAVVELFLMAKPGEPGVQAACRFCHWVLLHLEARGVAYEANFIDPKDKPASLLEMNPKGEMPVMRHGSKVLADSKSIVAYVDGTWPSPVVAEPKPRSAVGRFEKAKLTDNMWTMISADGDAERLEGRRLFLEELGEIDAMLRAQEGGGGGRGEHQAQQQQQQASPAQLTSTIIEDGSHVFEFSHENTTIDGTESVDLETKTSVCIDGSGGSEGDARPPRSTRARLSLTLSPTGKGGKGGSLSGERAPEVEVMFPGRSPAAYLRRRKEKKRRKSEVHKANTAAVKRSFLSSVKLWRKSRNWYDPTRVVTYCHKLVPVLQL